MSDKHSPGPWRWIEEDPNDPDRMPRLVDSDGLDVCSFGGGGSYDQFAGTPPDDADARLIAAAPEMLVLLRKAASVIEFHLARTLGPAETLSDDMRALLSRIDGKGTP